MKRAISHFQHASWRFSTKDGDALPLRYAIENRDELEQARHTMAYVFRSEYHKQILHWLRFFPREQQHFVILEELLAEPDKHLRDLHSFLEAPWHEAVSLPHSKNKRMADFTASLHVDENDVSALRDVLQGVVGAVEDVLGRKIPAWRD